MFTRLANVIVALSSSTVYYGLTADEARRAELRYEAHTGYDGKGVHLSLSSLRRFIHDYDMHMITHYVKVPIRIFDVLRHIDPDPEYDMVAVRTPFVIDLKKFKPRKL